MVTKLRCNLHILQSCQIRNQIIELKDKANIMAAVLCQFFI